MTGRKKFSELAAALLARPDGPERKKRARERLMAEVGRHAGRTGIANEYFLKDPHYRAAYKKARKI